MMHEQFFSIILNFVLSLPIRTLKIIHLTIEIHCTRYIWQVAICKVNVRKCSVTITEENPGSWNGMEWKVRL